MAEGYMLKTLNVYFKTRTQAYKSYVWRKGITQHESYQRMAKDVTKWTDYVAFGKYRFKSASHRWQSSSPDVLEECLRYTMNCILIGGQIGGINLCIQHSEQQPSSYHHISYSTELGRWLSRQRKDSSTEITSRTVYTQFWHLVKTELLQLGLAHLLYWVIRDEEIVPQGQFLL